MKKFTLFINGADLDTGEYEYFPYADKFISDFKTTFRILKQLKMGKISEDTEEANKYIFAKYCIGQKDTNLRAIKSAYNASKIFRKFHLIKRKKIFLDMYRLLLEKKEDLIKLLIIEGHPRRLAEWEFEGMEVGGRPETIDFFCDQIYKEIGRSEKEILYWARRPDGVVCLSPPRNAAASNSYLAAYVFIVGNTLVVKPPLRNPLSTIFLWKEVVNKALMRNGAPPGTLNIITGSSKVIMDEWLTSSYVNDIIHFGDSQKGLEIGCKVFQAGKKPILELSGNDLFLVWKDADLEKSTDALLDCFLGSTQICMVPKIALIHGNIYERFTAKFLDRVKKLKIALPTDPDTIFSPVGKIKDFFDYLNDALDKKAKLIYGGQRVNYNGREDKNGLYIMPTLIGIDDYKKALNMRCLKEEIFFPLLPLINISGNDEEAFTKMTDIVNNHQYGLRLSLWVSSVKYLRKFVEQLGNSGLLRINSRHVGFSRYLSSHGGTKRTGGPFGEMNYIWQKTSHLQGITRTKLK